VFLPRTQKTTPERSDGWGMYSMDEKGVGSEEFE